MCSYSGGVWSVLAETLTILNQVLPVFPQPLQANVGTVPRSRPWPLLSKYLTVHRSYIILPFDTTESHYWQHHTNTPLHKKTKYSNIMWLLNNWKITEEMIWTSSETVGDECVHAPPSGACVWTCVHKWDTHAEAPVHIPRADVCAASPSNGIFYGILDTHMGSHLQEEG